MLHDEYIAQPCPQCGEMVYIRIKDFNCRIFRHGVYKSTRKQIDSHSTKEECDELLSKYTSISAFTEDDKDKELIRPLLVTYGTEIRRKLDPNCWIKKIQDRVISKLDEGYYVFVTDVRFKNEAEWIRINGGTLINIARSGCPPANHEEHKQYHFMKSFYNYHVAWDTFGEDKIEKCDEYVIPFLNQLAINVTKFEQIM